MEGQWIGRCTGTNPGTVIIDVDDCGPYFQGTAALFEDEPGLPGSFVRFRTADCGDEHQFDNLNVTPLDPINYNLSDRNELIERYKAAGHELSFPQTAKIHLKMHGDELRASWTTDVGTSGDVTLPRSGATQPSEVVVDPNVNSWSAFKKVAGTCERGRFVFRGQPNTWRLRTAFHRTKRKDLATFMEVDIPRLHQVLSGQTKHFFQLTDAMQNGAFWNLIQHHGYPTPLLDWSYSPFVAAFFAYRNKALDDEKAPHVRIYMFDRKSWCEDYPQLGKIAPAMPHFSILEPLALENTRLVPQQALSSVTNIDDVETYLRAREQDKGKLYLAAFDLPATEMNSALSELIMMGISAGSLFPGLDGACEEWRYRLFGYRPS